MDFYAIYVFPVIIAPDNSLHKDGIEIRKEIAILLNNGQIFKKVKIDEKIKINIIDRLDDKKDNIE